MRLRLLLFVGFLILTVFVSADKRADDSEVEGSANVDNPDDEDFEQDSSGVPPDSDSHDSHKEEHSTKEEFKPTEASAPYSTTMIVKKISGVDSWSLDSTTIAILLGAFLLVIVIIVLAVICMRKQSRKSEYTHGTRQTNPAYV